DLIIHKKVPIDRFLLVTFANASAEEMRERIHKALYENLDNDFFIVEQLKKLPQASISTLHSFCSDLIRRYFYAIDIPPKFSILEPTKASLLKSRAIETLFDKKYEAKDPDFLRLVDIFSKSRNDDGLSDTLLSLYEFSRGIDDPLLFLTKTAFENYDNPAVFESLLSNRIDRKLSEFKRSTLDILDYMYSTVLDNDKTLCMNFVVQIDDILAQKTLGLKIQKIADISFPNLKRLKANCEYNEVNIHEKVGEIKSSLTKYLNSIKNYSDYLSNDAAILKIKNDVKMLCDLTIEFADAYALEKKKIDSLDFSDLEHFALKLLQNKEVLTDIQDKFDYVFVDEYQDTSKVQEALISAISTHNLFMVGDIKQSIYSFRQCDKNIFAEKEHRYKGNSVGELIFLNQNFRSGGKILNFVNQVFKNIMTAEVGDDYRANSMFDIKDGNGDVEMDLLIASKDDDEALPKIYSVKEDSQKDDEFVNAEKEGKLIANKIQSLVGTSFFDGKIERKITYSDFAILLRATSSTHAECVYKTLKDSGIPITISSSDSSLLDYPEVCQVINFISVLVNFQKDIPLLSVLRSPFFQFDDNELLEIRKCGTGKFFFECLKTIPADHPIFPKIKRFFDTIQFYKTVALARGGVYALSRAITETPFEMLTLALPYGGDKMKRVDKFIQLISSLDENKNLVELHLSIEKLKDELQLKDSDVTNDAVKMMSIHKSKGLEFPICFVGGITSTFNFKSASANVLFHSNFGVTIRDFDTDKRRRKDSLPYYAISQLIKDESVEEELRILYVALTRAKNKLFLTGIVKERSGGITSLN
ncbi:MAG: UvrD-helicase domain-containing protein, partial [Clostridia bacterium]